MPAVNHSNSKVHFLSLHGVVLISARPGYDITVARRLGYPSIETADKCWRIEKLGEVSNVGRGEQNVSPSAQQ